MCDQDLLFGFLFVLLKLNLGSVGLLQRSPSARHSNARYRQIDKIETKLAAIIYNFNKLRAGN